LLEKYPDRINWDNLSTNPNAIRILEQNSDKINWWHLSKNPNAIHLFAQLDREKMREQCKEFARELFSYVLHPARLMRLANEMDMDLEQYMEFLI
jgi:hypothetical protein